MDFTSWKPNPSPTTPYPRSQVCHNYPPSSNLITSPTVSSSHSLKPGGTVWSRHSS